MSSKNMLVVNKRETEWTIINKFKAVSHLA